MDVATCVVRLAQMGAGTWHDAVQVPVSAAAWSTIIRLAKEHRVAPLLWRTLDAAPAGSVPESVLAELEERVWQSRAAQMLCEDALGSLLEALAAQNIEVLVLKGAALAHDLYPCPELRPYHDLDMLCRPRDYPRMAAIVRAAGWSSEEPVVVLPADLADRSRRRNFLDQSGQVEIEVHLDVLGLGLKERFHDALWREAPTLRTGSLTLRTPAPMHQLLHLAVHAHAHCYSRLLWLIDIDLLIRRHAASLDWEQVMLLARDEGVGTVVRHALATVHALLGTPWPPLPRPTIEEALLGVCYRRLWPQATVARLERREHRRLMRFRPGTGDARDILYGFILLSRRLERLQAVATGSRTPSLGGFPRAQHR